MVDSHVAWDHVETLVKFWHTMNGIYLWEFVTTLDYEWNIFWGRRPYPWTIWIYSTTRIATLVTVIFDIMGFNVTIPFNCQLWVSLQIIFAYMAYAAASLLIVLRIIAVWDKNKVIVAIAASVWVIQISFLIQGIVRLRSTWVPSQYTCLPLNIESAKPTIVAILVTDIILLLIKLVGLLRLRSHGSGISRLGHLLWKQGLIWLALVVVGGVPPVVFMFLNINVEFNLMFQLPALVVEAIAATRMYRSLVEHASGGVGASKTALESLRIGSCTPSTGKRVTAAPGVLSRMEVAAQRDSVQGPTDETSRDGMHSDTSGPLGDRPLELVLDKLEKGVGN